jgi:hypothetical protein
VTVHLQCAAGTRIDGEYTCMAGGLVTFTLEPNSMVSEQFIARFTDDSANDFVVAAESYDIGKKEIRGELPRRGTGVHFALQPADPNRPTRVRHTGGRRRGRLEVDLQNRRQALGQSVDPV